MGLGSSRSVEFQISNKTQNITLKNARIVYGHEYCSRPPQPELSPGSSDFCVFSGDSMLWGMVGLTDVNGMLLYEADSFTLAVRFSNPVDHNKSSTELSLELSPGRDQLRDLGTTYAPEDKGTCSSTRVVVSKSHGTAELSYGPVRVMATMSCDASSAIEVVLEEQRGWGGIPWYLREDTSRRSETLQELLRRLKDSPGNAVPDALSILHASLERRRRL